MGSITRFEGMTLRSQEEYRGRYIDWLEKHYPQGFGTQHVTIFNRRRLPVEDYDQVVGPDDELSLVVLPGIGAPLVAAIFPAVTSAFWQSAIAGVANALLAMGLSYALNSIFAPKVKGPQMNDGDSASAVYSLSVPTNRARLGEPIPVIYGDVVAVPDLACQPYTFFNNGMWLAMILCLGQGEYEVDDLLIGGTSISSMPGLVYWKKFGPLDHQKTFYTIQTAMQWQYPYFGVGENVYVSPAVGGQQIPYSPYSAGSSEPPLPWLDDDGGFLSPADGVYSLDLPSSRIISLPREDVRVEVDRYTVSGTLFSPVPYRQGEQVGDYVVISIRSCTASDGSGNTLYYTCEATLVKYETQDLPAPPIPDTVTVGSTIRIYGTTHQDGAYTVSSIASDRLSCVVAPPFSQQTPTGAPRVSWDGTVPPCSAGCPSGSFVTTPKGKTTNYVEFDIIFPQGLYGVSEDDGSILNAWVNFTFVFTPVNDLDEPSGICFTRPYQIQYGGRTPARYSVGFSLPDGRYRVCLTRQTPISTSLRLINDAEWHALKSYVTTNIAQGDAYGDVTLIAVLMKATDGVAQSAQNQVSVKCRRILPTVLSDLQTVTATKNPADAFYDAFTNRIYGANRPSTEVDLPHLKELAADWATTSGWNGVFDTRTTVWEALSAIGFPYHAFPVTNGSMISMVEDVERNISAPRYAFTEDNIADRSLSISYQFDNAERIDGIEVLWRSPDDFAEQYALYPPRSVFPEAVTAMGLTDETEANALAMRLWNQRQLRRQFCSFTTELEGHIPLIGELITITHALLGPEETYWIVGAIEPQDELTVKVEGHRYVPEIYA